MVASVGEQLRRVLGAREQLRRELVLESKLVAREGAALVTPVLA